MKKGIHPDYVESTVTCSCGNTFTTRATKAQLRVELCNECHPFYTGQQKFVDTGGRVQRFAEKFGSASATVAEREDSKRKARQQAAVEAEQTARAAREEKAAKKAEKAARYAEKVSRASGEKPSAEISAAQMAEMSEIIAEAAESPVEEAIVDEVAEVEAVVENATELATEAVVEATVEVAPEAVAEAETNAETETVAEAVAEEVAEVVEAE